MRGMTAFLLLGGVLPSVKASKRDRNVTLPEAPRRGIMTTMRLSVIPLVLWMLVGSPAVARRVVELDGVWEIADSVSPDELPSRFERRVPVPGLADMAEPAFPEVGRESELRKYFWYRRTFVLEGELPETAVLKIHKARYGSRVLLNGHLVGDHVSSFTPGFFDVGSLLRVGGVPNELLIRVGAGREAVPEGVPTGWDFEKYLYIPGIYDSVRLILADTPRIVNVQVVPNIDQQTARIVAEIRNGAEARAFTLAGTVREVAGGRVVGETRSLEHWLGPGEEMVLEVSVSIADCRLWSPEDPFLYRLDLDTGRDSVTTRFGMRSFSFDRESGRAVLNGRPYFMRGTNVTAYRFFEDAQRGDRPWREDWVRRLHRKFKTMHWNSIRYCIGFPPDFWYDIADEEGFLIQDEFPIWTLHEAPENPRAERIIPEYTAWMRERWNHPSVVIWDAQNESVTEETGKAIQAVRHLDLSNRPWENGWARPQSPTDGVEAHPYLFIRAWQGREPFQLRELARHSGVPNLLDSQKGFQVPIIINEYGWLWLDREGEPTSLTREIYEGLLGPGATVEQRRQLNARYLAALTEFWRGRRQAAGVLHFCGLGYSRPGDKPRPEGGATSDHFRDLEALTFEPHFERRVGQAFNPLGLMLNYWEEDLQPGVHREFQVYLINDRYEDWRGEVRLEIRRGDQVVSVHSQVAAVPELGRTILSYVVRCPEEAGEYRIAAALDDPDGRMIESVRLMTLR
jgi:beta-galactosidase